MTDAAENNSTGVGATEQNTQPITEQQPSVNTQTTTTENQKTEGVTTPLGSKQNDVTPTQPTTYDFKPSIPQGFEFSQEQSDKFVDVIKDMNLSNEQANAIAKYGFEWAQGIAQQVRDSFQDQYQATANGWAEETKKAYGAGFDKAMANAGQAIEYLERNGVPNVRKMCDMTGAGSRVEMMQILNVVSKLIESDPGKGMTGSAAGGNSALNSFYNNSNFDKL